MLPNVELTDRTTQALSIGTVTYLKGTYENCLAPTAAPPVTPWTIDLMTPANTNLAVVLRDPTCKLRLQTLGGNATYSTTSPLLMDAAYQAAAGVFKNGTDEIFVNAYNSDIAFTADFTLHVLYSNLPDHVSDTIGSQYAVVNPTPFMGVEVKAPALALQMPYPVIKTDAAKKIVSATGSVVYSTAGVAGKKYKVVATDPGTTISQISSAFGSAAANPDVTSATGLTLTLTELGIQNGVTLPKISYVIVANYDAADLTNYTTPSYEVLVLTFGAP